MDGLVQLEHSELKALRRKLYDKNGGVCPILKIKVPFEDTVLDHKHKNKTSEAGVDGGGLIRGVLHFGVNVLEGKIANSYKRLGLVKFGVPLPEILRGLADYLEQDPLPIIHPNEKPKSKTLKKSVFNKLNKAYKLKYPKRKPLEYPTYTNKNRLPKMSEKWEILLAEFGLEN